MSSDGEIVLKSSSIADCTLCHILSFDRATELNHTLVSLLQDLSIRVDKEDMQRINDTIDDVSVFPFDAYSSACTHLS
jgi:hypothetical protein